MNGILLIMLSLRVLRFVPVAGPETKIPQNSLRKVVFTPDSVVLVAAEDGKATSLYKYDYQAILFDESSAPTGIEEVRSETVSTARSEKFIQNGQLFIRREGHVYDILGNKIQ